VAGEIAWVANERELLRIKECEDGASPLRFSPFPLEFIEQEAVEAFDDKRVLVFGRGPDTATKGSRPAMLYAYDGQKLRAVFYRRASESFSEAFKTKPERMTRSSDGEVIRVVLGNEICPIQRNAIQPDAPEPKCQVQDFGSRVLAVDRAPLAGPVWVGTERGAVQWSGQPGDVPDTARSFPIGIRIESISRDSKNPNIAWALAPPDRLYRLQVQPHLTNEIPLAGSFNEVRSIRGRLLLLGDDGIHECLDCDTRTERPQTRLLAAGRFLDVYEGPDNALWLSGARESALCRIDGAGWMRRYLSWELAISACATAAVLGLGLRFRSHWRKRDMERLFSWIHLSDMHFGHGDATHGWDQQLVLRDLLKDVKDLCQQHPDLAQPDAIFVTGDIAFSGNGLIREPENESREYEQARQWLDTLANTTKLGPGRIFTVPGNHDVNRKVDSDQDVRRLVRSIRDGTERLDAALTHEPDREKLARRMAAYLEFAAGLAPACLEPTPQKPKKPTERLFWAHREVHGRMHLRLIGLNTALLAAGDDDKGKLELGKEQLAKTLLTPTLSPNELVIILSHHPLRGDWLRDGRAADKQIVKDAHIHLFGHVHEAETESGRGGSGKNLVRVAAGAAHGEALPPGVSPSHGYSMGCVYALADGQLLLRLWPRRWSEEQGFLMDVINTFKGKDYTDHELSLMLSPSSGERAERKSTPPGS
jgi:calcineurin-like phosphoesterase family protein